VWWNGFAEYMFTVYNLHINSDNRNTMVKTAFQKAMFLKGSMFRECATFVDFGAPLQQVNVTGL